jgi:hypothetical protein
MLIRRRGAEVRACTNYTGLERRKAHWRRAQRARLPAADRFPKLFWVKRRARGIAGAAPHRAPRIQTVGREYEPVAGKWYRDLEEDESFQVLRVDEDEELVEIQHLDGDIEEIDLDTWSEMDVEPSEEPEGWSGSGDDEDDDDDDWDEDEDEDEDDDDDDWDDDEDEDDEDRERDDY